jgi:hypothetical protein
LRIALAVIAGTAGLLVGVVPAAASAPPVGSAQYVVRVDPRLCPSPLCGGYWVALANRARTRCSDGALRARCYAGRALDEDREPLATSVPDGSLVRGALEPWSFGGFGELGSLVVADVKAPLGTGAEGTFYRVRDLGIRCVRAPCFSYRATRLNGSYRTTVSDVDLLAAQPTPHELARAQIALRSPAGLFVQGRITRTSDSGRILRASRLYLKAALPRA